MFRCSFRTFIPNHQVLLLNRPPIHHSATRFYSAKSNPLKILFCGSDEFSIVSLRKLYEKHKEDESFIKSIDVVCKQGKPSGRGLKDIRDVPIKQAAKNLSLPVHEIPTFTKWEPPEKIDLIIAVSFGLRVPPRILNHAQHGGLNVHPSLLPKLRGPAPLQHTLLNGLKHSGVTVQTLHPEAFDQGVVIAQDRFDIPPEVSKSLYDLTNRTAVHGANLLERCLREKLYVSPVEAPDAEQSPASEAPKLGKESAQIDWEQWDCERILRTQAAIGPVWNNFQLPNSKTAIVKWHNLTVKAQRTDIPPYRNSEELHTYVHPNDSSRALSDSEDQQSQDSHGPHGAALEVLDHASIAGLWTRDGQFLSPESITVEGQKREQFKGDSVGAVNHLNTTFLSPRPLPLKGTV